MNSCMNKYKFCTNGVGTSLYKEFTCPPFGCDEVDGNRYVKLSSDNPVEVVSVRWSFFDAGMLCRVIVSSDE